MNFESLMGLGETWRQKQKLKVASKVGRARRRFRPSLEGLEARDLMAAMVNSPPTIDSLSPLFVAFEGTAYNTTVNFTDPDGDNSPYEVTIDWGDGTTASTYSNATSGQVFSHSYVDGDNAFTQSITVADAFGATSTPFTRGISVINTAPFITGFVLPTTIDEGSLLSMQVNFGDKGVNDTHAATINWDDGLTEVFNNIVSGQTYTHTYVNGPKTPKINIQITDNGSSNFRSSNVQTNFFGQNLFSVLNAAPVVATPTFQSSPIIEGGTATMSFSFTDAGVNDTHSATIDWGDGSTPTVILSAVAGTTITRTHDYNVNPTTPTAPYTVTVNVTDNDGGVGSNTAVIDITAINNPPAAVITPTIYNAIEQTNLDLKNMGLSVSDSDAGSGNVTATLSVSEGVLFVTPGTSGATVSNSGTSTVSIIGTIVQINDLLNNDGTSTVVYIDDLDSPSAAVTLTLAIDDNGNTGTGGSLTASDTATINVTALNDAATITGTAIGSVTEDGTLTAGDTLSVRDADTGENTFQAVLPAALTGTYGNFTFKESSGAWGYTLSNTAAVVQALAAGATPTDTLTVTSFDGTATQTITVTVNGANDVPELASIGNKLVNEGEMLSFTATASDIDLPANTLTFSLSGQPDGASITPAGLFSWTPSEAQGPGTYTFDVVVRDGTATDFETIEVTVSEVNASPVLATISDKTVKVGNKLNLNVSATDADLPVQNLTYGLDATSLAAGLKINPNTGAISFKPTIAQANTVFNVTVTVSDGDGGTDSQTFKITVPKIPDAGGKKTITVNGTADADSIIIAKVNGNYVVFANVGTAKLRIFSAKGITDFVVDAGAGDDTVIMGAGVSIPTTIRGGAGNDFLSGGSARDTIDGGSDNDQIFGNLGNDILLGGTGNDILSGGFGNDFLSGGAGNDVLTGDSGNDILIGGLEFDILNDSDGRDLLIGGRATKEADVLAASQAISDWLAGQTAKTLRDLGSYTDDQVDDLFTGNLDGDVRKS